MTAVGPTMTRVRVSHSPARHRHDDEDDEPQGSSPRQILLNRSEPLSGTGRPGKDEEQV